MQTKVRPTGPIERNLHVVIDPDELNEEFDQQIKSLASKAVLPGFRKGNVPKQLVRERYGKNILDEIKFNKTQESLKEAAKELDSKVAHISRVDYLSERDEVQLEYIVDLVVEPDVNIDALENLRIVRPIAEISEEDIDRKLDFLLVRRGLLEESDAPIAIGHRVSFNIVDIGSNGARLVENVAEYSDCVTEYTMGQEYPDKNDIILNILMEELVGKTRNEEFVIDREFPILEQFEDESTIEGKVSSESARVGEENKEESCDRLHIKVFIESTKRAIHPSKLNEEFFKSLNHDDINNIDDLRARIKKSVDEGLRKEADSLVNSQILQQLNVMNPIVVPFDMVIKFSSDYDPNVEFNFEVNRSRIVKGWIINQYAEKYDIQVSQKDVNEVLMMRQEIFKRFGQSTDMLHTEEFQTGIHHQLVEEKVLMDIPSRIEIEERPTSVDDFEHLTMKRQLADTKPDGGPFTWNSPVSEDEISRGKKEVEVLRSRLEASENDEATQEIEQASEAEGEKKEGVFKRLLRFVGVKK